MYTLYYNNKHNYMHNTYPRLQIRYPTHNYSIYSIPHYTAYTVLHKIPPGKPNPESRIALRHDRDIARFLRHHITISNTTQTRSNPFPNPLTIL